DLATERWRLLKSADENNPMIVNLDNELKKLKARIDNEDKKNATTVKFEVKKYSDDPEVHFAVVDEVPIFPGCEDAADKRACFNDKIQLHISKNFNYPLAAHYAGIQGRVSAMFLITSDGTIDNIKMRGPDKLLEDEVERIIKRLPIMTPGKHKGKLADVPFSIPVNFKLK
ncbi:MAG: TonB family protein, partial [Maribacter arcticus]|uniref:energy transducer TonB n=1 Tax=Maribacter arcticus TaxID=561365 RepID=UPI0030035EF9